MSKKHLVIVAGAPGEIGTAFCKKIITSKMDCIAIFRQHTIRLHSQHLKEVRCDLENLDNIKKSFKNIDFTAYSKIIYLHTIGVDKFDPRGYPKIKPMKTIDPQVYKTNVNSFKYLLRYCVSVLSEINKDKKTKVKFRVAIIAGVADKYTPFVIESFCEAKFIIRQYIQSYINLYPKWISGLSINISSTITKSALRVRPHANTKYWLTPTQVVEKSFKTLTSKFNDYKEFDIIKSSPHFVKDYYINDALLYKKWSQETGMY